MTSLSSPDDHTPHPHRLDPTPRQLRLLRSGEHLELDALDQVELTFLERTLCQVSLPYRNPGEQVSYWTRRNGRLQLTVRPGIGPDGTPVWAYGVLPRLLLMWITDQVIKNTDAVDGRTITFADSLRGFLEDLGITYTGPNGKRVRHQVWALANTTLSLNEFSDERARGANMLIADSHDLLWTRRTDSPAMLADSYITLSERFHEAILAHPIPLEASVVAALRTQGGGGLALDIFCWLKYRMHSARRRGERFPLRITWDGLAQQFGSQYKLTRQFKAKFIPQLQCVVTAWPMVRFDAQDKTLLLWPTQLYQRQLR